MSTTFSLTMRIGRRTLALIAMLLVYGASLGTTGAEAAAVLDQASQDGDVYFSLVQPGSLNVQSVPGDATAGARWCDQIGAWIYPDQRRCARRREQQPFGNVSVVNGEVRIGSGSTYAAPFLWAAAPGRQEPFPPEGDFVLEAEITVEQLGAKSVDLQVARWLPPTTTGGSNPLNSSILTLSADGRGLQVTLLGTSKTIASPMARHAYRLEYIGGEYTVYVDDAVVIGPTASASRPNALWLGSPLFTWWFGEWSDLRVAKLLVKIPNPAIEVPFDVKPSGCPSPVIRNARGDLPTAIMGSADLDVRQIDVSTVALGGVRAHRSAVQDVGAPAEPYIGKTAEDCNAAGPDGFPDLTLKFDNAAVAALLEDVRRGDTATLSLTGALVDGTPIVGEDVVVVR